MTARREPGWDVVREDLAGAIGGIVREHGPDAVAGYGGNGGNGGAQDNSGYALVNRFVRNLGSRGWYTALTIDSPAKGLVAELMSGFSGLTTHVDHDCRLIVLIGTNPAVSHGHTSSESSPMLLAREWASAGELWVLDPRRTETARAATRHLARGGRALRSRDCGRAIGARRCGARGPARGGAAPVPAAPRVPALPID